MIKCDVRIVKLNAVPLLCQNDLQEALGRDKDTCCVITREHIVSRGAFDILLERFGIVYQESEEFVLNNYRDIVAMYASEFSGVPCKFFNGAYRLVKQQMEKVLMAMTCKQFRLVSNPFLYRLLLTGFPGSGKSVTLQQKMVDLTKDSENLSIVAASMSQFYFHHYKGRIETLFDIDFKDFCKKYKAIQCIFSTPYQERNVYISRLLDYVKEHPNIHLFIDEVDQSYLKELEPLIETLSKTSYIWFVIRPASTFDPSYFISGHKFRFEALHTPMRYTNNIQKFISHVCENSLDKYPYTADLEGRVTGFLPIVAILPPCEDFNYKCPSIRQCYFDIVRWGVNNALYDLINKQIDIEDTC